MPSETPPVVRNGTRSWSDDGCLISLKLEQSRVVQGSCNSGGRGKMWGWGGYHSALCRLFLPLLYTSILHGIR